MLAWGEALLLLACFFPRIENLFVYVQPVLLVLVYLILRL